MNSPWMVNEQKDFYQYSLFSLNNLLTGCLFLRAAMPSCGLQITFPNLLCWLMLPGPQCSLRCSSQGAGPGCNYLLLLRQMQDLHLARPAKPGLRRNGWKLPVLQGLFSVSHTLSKFFSKYSMQCSVPVQFFWFTKMMKN